MAGSQDTMMIVVMMMMMSSVFSVLAGGAYFMNKPQEGDECKGTSVGGNYVIDEDGECVLDYCDYGYTESGGGCVVVVPDGEDEDEDEDSSGGADADADADAGADADADAGGSDAPVALPVTLSDAEAQCYLDSNPDLQEYYGGDNVGGAQAHWQSFGRNETIAGTRVKFECIPLTLTDAEAQCYLDSNPDLQDYYGPNNVGGAQGHWQGHGRKETVAGTRARFTCTE
jgi:hypothetical protein